MKNSQQNHSFTGSYRVYADIGIQDSAMQETAFRTTDVTAFKIRSNDSLGS
ncbi:hypothetical protein IFU39_08780 [Paenibacillus sp. CFBP 13594]|nr:hypothetical protein [Paenibacillus sp. CFBP 13594]